MIVVSQLLILVRPDRKKTIEIQSLADNNAVDWNQFELVVNLSIMEHAYLIIREFPFLFVQKCQG